MKKHGLRQRPTVKTQTALWVKFTVGISISAIIIALSFFVYNTLFNSNDLKAEDKATGPIVNQAIKLNGVNQYLEIGAVNFNLVNKLTVMAWVKWDTLPIKGNAWANIISVNKTTISDNGQFWLQHNSNNTKFEFSVQIASNRYTILSTTAPVQNVWYHLAGTYDGTKIRLFINGVEESNMSKSGNIQGFNKLMTTEIGQWAYTATNRRFKGTIDDVVIYDKALTATEINSKMNPDNIASTDVGLLGAWKFNEPSKGLITDISPYKRNVQNITNAPLVISTVSQSDAANLPIVLSHFDVKAKGSSAIIKWTTVAELNNEFFTVERSRNGEDYKVIIVKQGAGTSQAVNSYSFEDTELSDGVYYYRLSQTDYDGTTVYYDPISIRLSNLDDLKVYPNPVRQGEIVTINGLHNGYISLKVYTADGKMVMDVHSNENQDFELSTELLNKGLHILIIGDGVAEKVVKLEVY